ncbi:MAG: SprT family zinc-dependent metalloprotease [Tepidiformaceae bacterium]
MRSSSKAIGIDGDVVRYVVERSKVRRKTIAIRLEPDGSLLVRAPMRTAVSEIESALTLRRAWITRARAEAAVSPEAIPLCQRATLPYLGEERPVVDCLPAVPDFAPLPPHGPPAAQRTEQAASARLVAWYRAAAGLLLPPQVAHRAAQLGHTPSRVVISRQRHAWGSCGRDGTIRLSYRLMMLRPELIDCVIVHELCHLVQHNHSPAFWAEMACWQPDHRRLRAELRSAGIRLPL